MGAAPSKAIQKEEARLLQQYSVREALDQEWVLQDKYEEALFLLKRFDLDSSQLQPFVQRLQRKLQSANENLLGLVQYKSFDLKGVPVVYALLQLTPLSLAEEIASRLEEQRHFEEEQLVSIFCCCALALKQLNTQEESHGSVCPQNIFLSESGIVQVMDPLGGRVVASQPEQGLFLSPEVLSCIRDNEQREVDGMKSDIFALGMCLVECALLSPAIECYNYEAMELDFRQLHSRLKQVARLYSPEFVRMLESMLHEDWEQRADIDELQYLQNLANSQSLNSPMDEAQSLPRDHPDRGCPSGKPAQEKPLPVPDHNACLESEEDAPEERANDYYTNEYEEEQSQSPYMENSLQPRLKLQLKKPQFQAESRHSSVKSSLRQNSISGSAVSNSKSGMRVQSEMNGSQGSQGTMQVNCSPLNGREREERRIHAFKQQQEINDFLEKSKEGPKQAERPSQPKPEEAFPKDLSLSIHSVSRPAQPRQDAFLSGGAAVQISRKIQHIESMISSLLPTTHKPDQSRTIPAHDSGLHFAPSGHASLSQPGNMSSVVYSVGPVPLPQSSLAPPPVSSHTYVHPPDNYVSYSSSFFSVEPSLSKIHGQPIAFPNYFKQDQPYFPKSQLPTHSIIQVPHLPPSIPSSIPAPAPLSSVSSTSYSQYVPFPGASQHSALSQAKFGGQTLQSMQNYPQQNYPQQNYTHSMQNYPQPSYTSSVQNFAGTIPGQVTSSSQFITSCVSRDISPTRLSSYVPVQSHSPLKKITPLTPGSFLPPQQQGEWRTPLGERRADNQTQKPPSPFLKGGLEWRTESRIGGENRVPNNSEDGKEQLFTDPKLMEMVRRDLQRFRSKQEQEAQGKPPGGLSPFRKL